MLWDGEALLAPQAPEMYLMCDNLERTLADLASHDVTITWYAERPA